ncbi:MAG: acetoin utilization protein AcuC [Nitrososphaerota archaeon]
MLYIARGEELLRYSFGPLHPMNQRRLEAFYRALDEFGTGYSVFKPFMASVEEIRLFHDEDYIKFVQLASQRGVGYLDYGDTPAFPGVFEAASYVVGTTLGLVKLALREGYRGFNPMGGLHHAMRSKAGGFCVFNDAAVAIEYLLKVEKLEAVAYVDIDAHHGDGVYYEFEDDPRVVFLDLHQDGRTLYPGTGFRDEMGRGEAWGRKLNIPLPPGANDVDFRAAFDEGLGFLEKFEFGFILFQCGADGVEGDPLTRLEYSHASHRYAATALRKLAEEKCGGRIVAMGGGGYSPENVAKAWMEVVRALA